MLATFCLRLACGLAGALLPLPAAQINPRFYRAHFLTVLGLTAFAAINLSAAAGMWLWLALAAVLLSAFLGSLVWSLDGAPAGKLLVVLTTALLVAALAVNRLRPTETPRDEAAAPTSYSWLLADDLASAALLGAATTAMLMGHSYLIAPSMSLTPLLRLLAALFVALGVRAALAGFGLWTWTAGHSLANLEDETVLWLPLRWGLGFVAPVVLGWMAWQTTKIRSTQSATGILYVVVIFCFLGEVTSQVLLRDTGHLL
jgi:hypothetical protein